MVNNRLARFFYYFGYISTTPPTTTRRETCRIFTAATRIMHSLIISYVRKICSISIQKCPIHHSYASRHCINQVYRISFSHLRCTFASIWKKLFSAFEHSSIRFVSIRAISINEKKSKCGEMLPFSIRKRLNHEYETNPFDNTRKTIFILTTEKLKCSSVTQYASKHWPCHFVSSIGVDGLRLRRNSYGFYFVSANAIDWNEFLLSSHKQIIYARLKIHSAGNIFI